MRLLSCPLQEERRIGLSGTEMKTVIRQKMSNRILVAAGFPVLGARLPASTSSSVAASAQLMPQIRAAVRSCTAPRSGPTAGREHAGRSRSTAPSRRPGKGRREDRLPLLPRQPPDHLRLADSDRPHLLRGHQHTPLRDFRRPTVHATPSPLSTGVLTRSTVMQRSTDSGRIRSSLQGTSDIDTGRSSENEGFLEGRGTVRRRQ